MPTACDTCLLGDLTTITFGTSGFTAEYTSIGGNTISREAVEFATLGPQTCRARCPGDIIDYGENALEFCFDGDNHPPYDGDPEPVTVTWPPKPGQTNGPTLAGSAFIREYGLPTASPDERLLATAVLVWDCDTEPVFTAGS